MDTAPSVEAGSPSHKLLRALAAATRLMAERRTMAVSMADVVAEVPDLDGQTISTLFTLVDCDMRVRYPNFEDLNDAIVYLADRTRSD